jgi:hypothetical protein
VAGGGLFNDVGIFNMGFNENLVYKGSYIAFMKGLC